MWQGFFFLLLLPALSTKSDQKTRTQSQWSRLGNTKTVYQTQHKEWIQICFTSPTGHITADYSLSAQVTSGSLNCLGVQDLPLSMGFWLTSEIDFFNYIRHGLGNYHWRSAKEENLVWFSWGKRMWIMEGWNEPTWYLVDCWKAILSPWGMNHVPLVHRA